MAIGDMLARFGLAEKVDDPTVKAAEVDKGNGEKAKPKAVKPVSVPTQVTDDSAVNDKMVRMILSKVLEADTDYSAFCKAVNDPELAEVIPDRQQRSKAVLKMKKINIAAVLRAFEVHVSALAEEKKKFEQEAQSQQASIASKTQEEEKLKDQARLLEAKIKQLEDERVGLQGALDSARNDFDAAHALVAARLDEEKRELASFVSPQQKQ